MAGLTFILSGGAAILAKYGGHAISPWEKALVLSVVSGLWLVVAVYFLGDISAHFNPAVTLAFALRRDMEWVMVLAYCFVQFAAAVGGSLLARSSTWPTGPSSTGRSCRWRSVLTSSPGQPWAGRSRAPR
jgi:aquaporin Z